MDREVASGTLDAEHRQVTFPQKSCLILKRAEKVLTKNSPDTDEFTGPVLNT